MIEIPEGVEVSVDGQTVTVKGEKGELKRTFKCDNEIKKTDGGIEVTGPLAMTNTIYGHISNMMKGVTQGYEKNMKAVYSHFPMNIEVKGKEVIIKNFIGEKKPRETKVIGNETEVKVKGQDITVSGIDKEAVGQTAANLRNATRITKKDSRVFQDGIYPSLE